MDVTSISDGLQYFQTFGSLSKTLAPRLREFKEKPCNGAQPFDRTPYERIETRSDNGQDTLLGHRQFAGAGSGSSYIGTAAPDSSLMRVFLPPNFLVWTHASHDEAAAL
jgi:hypothetical protein